MYEYSYQLDYGAAAEKYGDAFMENIRWENVSRLHHAHGEMNDRSSSGRRRTISAPGKGGLR